MLVHGGLNTNLKKSLTSSNELGGFNNNKIEMP